MVTEKNILIPVKDLVIFILLIELILVPLVPFVLKIILILFLLFLLLIISPKISSKFIDSIKPLFLILLIAIVMGSLTFFSRPYDFLRDGYYFFQPILLIFLGYCALTQGIRFYSMLKLIVFSSIILTTYFYIDFFLSLFLGQGISFESRYVFGLNSDFAIIGLLIVYSSHHARLNIFDSLTKGVLISIFLFLIFISFSRTNILISLLIILYPYILKLISFKMQLITVGLLVAIPVFFGSVLNFAIPEEGATNFISKLMNSYSEIIVRDYRESDAIAPDANLINLYWRSQEAFLGLSKYLEGNTFQLIFGQGLGSYASAAGIFENKFQQIPFFHNGFITIILKSGAIGLFLFFLFLYVLGNLFNKNLIQYANNSEKTFISLAGSALIFIIIIKTFFIMGFYTPESPVLLLTLIGVLIKKSLDFQLSAQT